MNYMLMEFQDEYCKALKRIYPRAHDIAKALDYYEKHTIYNDFEVCAMWAINRLVNKFDNYELYDKIREKYPDCLDRHIATLIRNSIKHCYGHSIVDLLHIYRNTDYHSLELFK